MSRHTQGTQIGKDVLDVQKYLEIFPVFPVQSSVWGLYASVSQRSKPIYNDVINQLPNPLCLSISSILRRWWSTETKGK